MRSDSVLPLPYGEDHDITAEELLSLAARFRQLMEAELDGSLVATLPGQGTLYGASDLHGSLDSLRNVLDMSGVLAPGDSHLLVLGDYVDKGPDSIALLASVMTLKLRFPDRFTLLRGNHETRFLGSWFMSFRRELRRRYGWRCGGRVLAGLLFAMDTMPIIAVSANGLVGMHGGPPRSLVLTGLTHAVLHDVLWSDIHKNERRDSKGRVSLKRLFKGRFVASDEVEHFLANVGKAVILRGHSHTAKGVELIQGNVLTVISANSLRRFGPLFGRRAQRGLVVVDLGQDLQDASQVGIRFF